MFHFFIPTMNYELICLNLLLFLSTLIYPLYYALDYHSFMQRLYTNHIQSLFI